MKKKKKTQKGKNSGSNAITGMNSIRNKIMLLIGGILIFVMIVSGIVVVTSVRSLVHDNEEDISSLATEGLVSEMDIAFEKYISMAQSAANDQSVRNLFSELYTREGFDLNPNFAGAYGTIGSLQNTDSNISMVYAISSRTDVGFDGFDWVCDEGFDLTTRAYWFADQEDIDRGFIITEPYLDVASGNMVVGISAPVYDTTGSSIVGVIGIDIQTTNIDSLIVNFDTPYNEENTRTMLFSGNNEVLAAADSSLLLMPAEELGLSSSIVNEIMEPSGKVVSYSDDGKKYYGIVKEDEVSGWKVLLGISKSEFMKYSWMISFKLVAIYLLAVAIMLAVMYSISKQITAPLARLTTITEELADGRLDTVIDINSNDETGKLAIAMKRLVTRLQEYIIYIDEVSENLDRFASGELTMNLKQSYSGEFSKLKVSMNNISERFRDTIGDIVNASQRLAGSSNEIANASHMLAEGASNQASTTEQLTSTIHELSKRVSYNAEHAKNASDQVRSVGERAISGNAQMKEMITAIEGIEKKSEEISKIIRVIEDISFQTNILALNAAVEAARAGQAGKGFSVVADEVRNLANKSAEAAQDTTVLIGETVESIRVGTALAEEAGIMLNGVIEGVQQTVELINDISQASQDQAVALRETLNGVEQISTVVQTNAATAEESSASSSELSRQAGELSEVVAQFRL